MVVGYRGETTPVELVSLSKVDEDDDDVDDDEDDNDVDDDEDDEPLFACAGLKAVCVCRHVRCSIIMADLLFHNLAARGNGDKRTDNKHSNRPLSGNLQSPPCRPKYLRPQSRNSSRHCQGMQ